MTPQTTRSKVVPVNCRLACRHASSCTPKLSFCSIFSDDKALSIQIGWRGIVSNPKDALNQSARTLQGNAAQRVRSTQFHIIGQQRVLHDGFDMQSWGTLMIGRFQTSLGKGLLFAHNWASLRSSRKALHIEMWREMCSSSRSTSKAGA